jgi:hypothetical protein
MTCSKNVKFYLDIWLQGGGKAVVCDHEVTGLSPRNSLLQKCRERLPIIVLDALSVWYDGSLMQRDGCRLVAPMWSRLTRLTG